MMPAPIQPASTPQAHRLPQSAVAQLRAVSTSLLYAKLTPVHGLTYPSARACIGAHTHATAAVSTRVFIARRIVPTPSARLIAPRERRCKRCALDGELRRVDRAAEEVRVRIVGSSVGPGACQPRVPRLFFGTLAAVAQVCSSVHALRTCSSRVSI